MVHFSIDKLKAYTKILKLADNTKLGTNTLAYFVAASLSKEKKVL
jgi:hypothetical protein